MSSADTWFSNNSDDPKKMLRFRIAFLIFLTIFSAILALGHWFVYASIAALRIVEGEGALTFTAWALVLLPATFILTSFLGQKYNNFPLRLAYRVSAFSLGVVTYLGLASFVSWVLLLLLSPGVASATLVLLMRLLYLAALLASAYGLWNALRPVVREVTLKLPRLPAAWANKTAVLFADTHLGHVLGKKFMEKVVALVNEQKPDVVFIAGDIFDGPKIDFSDAASPLRDLRAPWGAYFAFGDHDEFVKRTLVVDALSKTNLNILEDRVAEVEGVQILGLNYRFNQKPQEFLELIESIKYDRVKPTILIFHAPVNVPEVAKSQIDLMLSGHAHLGQFWPVNYITRAIYGPYHYGLNQTGNLTIYTTNGVGVWGPLMRVGNRPEIVKIKFQ